jgi:NADH dehydrogenase
MLDAARRAGVKRFIHMSAIGSRPYARSRYHQTKWEAEAMVRSSELDWTVFRPSVIYGEGDHLVSFLRKLVSWPWNLLNSYHLPVLGGGYSRIQPVAVEEVARCFVLALSRPASIRVAMDVCGPAPIAWRDFIAQIVRSTGQKAVFDDWWGLFFLRNVIWFLAVSLPIVLFMLGILGAVPGYFMAIIGVATLGAVWAAWAWRDILLVRVPFWPFIALGWLADWLLPPYARFSGLLAMLDEDNEGYPVIAEEMFGYKAQPLEKGLERLA